MNMFILGASGMIGHRLFASFSNCNDFESVIGVVGASNPELLSKFKTEKSKIIALDLVHEFAKLVELIDQTRPTLIVNACGVTIRKIKELKSYSVYDINSVLSKKLSYLCEERGIRLIHLSTDCVFSGKSGPYFESSIPDASDDYGKSKFLGEISGAYSLTLRFSAIGQELISHTELLDWFLRSDLSEIRGFDSVLYSGITTPVLAREIIKIATLHKRMRGLFQISSTPISKYELLCIVNEVFEKNISIKRDDSLISNKVLSCDKFSRETGFKAPSWRDMILELRALEVDY